MVETGSRRTRLARALVQQRADADRVAVWLGGVAADEDMANAGVEDTPSWISHG